MSQINLIRCDRCGYESESGSGVMRWEQLMPNAEKTIDLCAVCFGLFKQFLAEGKKVEP